MLAELRIKDFAIIQDLTLQVGPGFTAFTGETGAGKSIIIDAVELLVGGRADASMIRSGAQAALIEGSFLIDDAVREEVSQLLEREGLLEDHDTVFLGREIRAQGRNICRINGRTINLATLNELGQWLVDIHGQSEHLSLRRVPQHVDLLDRYAQVEQLRADYQGSFQRLRRVREALSELRRQEQETSRRSELLAYQIEEIEAARLQPGEYEALQEQQIRLANAERLAQAVERALAALDQSGERQFAAVDLLGRASQAMRGLAELDPSMRAAGDEAQALLESASALARELRTYLENLEFDPFRLQEVEDRLSLIHDLQRKYGDGIERILAYAEAARLELEGLTSAGEQLIALQDQEALLLQQLAESGGELSNARRRAAGSLAQAIEALLGELRMEGARFGVDIAWKDDPRGLQLQGRQVGFGATGLDQVEFLVETNPGEGLKPLTKIASGGETSRLMLGLKSVLAAADRTPTLIFDEVDQGIGGRVGSVVGRTLWELARNHQVLCITHLPQLAAYADQHYRIEKQVQGGRTITTAQPLRSQQDRIAELALMLGQPDPTTLQSAAELMNKAFETRAIAAAGAAK